MLGPTAFIACLRQFSFAALLARSCLLAQLSSPSHWSSQRPTFSIHVYSQLMKNIIRLRYTRIQYTSLSAVHSPLYSDFFGRHLAVPCPYNAYFKFQRSWITHTHTLTLHTPSLHLLSCIPSHAKLAHFALHTTYQWRNALVLWRCEVIVWSGG